MAKLLPMGRSGKRLLLGAGCVVALLVPASAGADIGSLYGEYTADGSIDGCKHSGAELQNAIGSVPTDVQQYDPRFLGELNRALAQRSRGCSSGNGGGTPQSPLGSFGGGGGSSGGSPHAADGSPSPGRPVSTDAKLANSPDISGDHGFPLALAILGALIAMILTGAGVMALSRRFGWHLPDIFSGTRTKLTR